MNQSIYDFLKDYIQYGDRHLDEETRAVYFKALENMKNGDFSSDEEIGEFSEYLEEQVNLIEDRALEERDTDGINQLAEMRNAQLELQKALWLLEPVKKEEQKQDATQQVLSRIAQAAVAV